MTSTGTAPDDPMGDQRSGQWFDYGPRFDYVLLHSGINDVGAVYLLGGQDPMKHGPDSLQSLTKEKCDLTDELRVLRRYFPNATIIVHGYHNIISNESRYCPERRPSYEEDADNPKQCGSLGEPDKWPHPTTDEILHYQTCEIIRRSYAETDSIPDDVDNAGRRGGSIGVRADKFQEWSEQALAKSVVNLNNEADQFGGRGGVVMANVRKPDPVLKLVPFDGKHALGLVTSTANETESWVHSLQCVGFNVWRSASEVVPLLMAGGLQGVKKGVADEEFDPADFVPSTDNDRLRDNRRSACEAFWTDPLGDFGEIEFCARAAAFHPTKKGARAFFLSACETFKRLAGTATEDCEETTDLAGGAE